MPLWRDRVIFPGSRFQRSAHLHGLDWFCKLVFLVFSAPWMGSICCCRAEQQQSLMYININASVWENWCASARLLEVTHAELLHWPQPVAQLQSVNPGMWCWVSLKHDFFSSSHSESQTSGSFSWPLLQRVLMEQDCCHLWSYRPSAGAHEAPEADVSVQQHLSSHSAVVVSLLHKAVGQVSHGRSI